MTVAEYIEKLKEMPQDLEVVTPEWYNTALCSIATGPIRGKAGEDGMYGGGEIEDKVIAI